LSEMSKELRLISLERAPRVVSYGFYRHDNPLRSIISYKIVPFVLYVLYLKIYASRSYV
jgi:hypothetical protein